MIRVWGHVAATLSVLAGATAAVPGCVHDDSTIFIRDVLAPQYAHAGMVCQFTADPGQPVVSSGVLDIALRLSYDAEYLIGNQLVPQVNSNQLQTETSVVTIQGAIVRITSASGHQLNKYTRLAAATILPSSGNTPGFAPVGVTIIDPNTILLNPDIQARVAGTALGQSGTVRLVTYVRFFGQTLGGRAVESNEFEYPVDVCNGCLISFTNNPSYPTPNCVGVAGGGSAGQAQLPCTVGQDLGVDCSLVCQGATSCPGAFQVPPDAGAGVDGGSD